MDASPLPAERNRLALADAGEEPWKLWGPYVSDRQWGTVREDYSKDGNAWDYFPFEHSQHRAYRWGEDGLAAVSDAGQRLCLGLALWNGVDPILKERLYGLANEQGNHGEDVKELYYHIDATPTASYLKFLYKYPQREFPYRKLLEENRRRSRKMPEYELIDTGVFDGDDYWDVFVEYAKATANDVLMKVTVCNRGPKPATLHVLPHIWFRNTWSWVNDAIPPMIKVEGANTIAAAHLEWSDYRCHFDGSPTFIFCDNETNARKLFDSPGSAHPKNSFHEYLVAGNKAAVNPERHGTKAAAHYTLTVPPRSSATVPARLRFFAEPALDNPFADFDAVFEQRIKEADEFFGDLQKSIPSEDARRVHRQAFAGLVWTKQYYQYDVWQWLHGDDTQPQPPAERKTGRNADWEHLKNADIVSMPDKWEYPWYAAWDLAFHAVPFAVFDPEFAKTTIAVVSQRPLHAPERPVAGLRMELQRYEPAGACRRLLVRLSHGCPRAGPPGPRISSSDASTS